MGSAREGTVEHRPSLLKCHYDCLFVLRKELKFILATHTDGRVWTRRGAPAYNQVGRGGAVRPSRPIAKFATAYATGGPTTSTPASNGSLLAGCEASAHL